MLLLCYHNVIRITLLTPQQIIVADLRTHQVLS